MNSGDTYKSLLAMLVCSMDNKTCMLGKCEHCPDKQVLIDYLYNFFGDFDENYQVFLHNRIIQIDQPFQKWLLMFQLLLKNMFNH